jgi:hypothetical protein
MTEGKAAHAPPQTGGPSILRARFTALAALVGCLALAAGTAAAEEPELFKILKLEGHKVRWQAPAGHLPVVTYAVAAEPLAFPGAHNCGKLAPLDRLLATSELSRDDVMRELTAAFAMWEAAADIRFVPASGDRPADIVIGAQGEPQGWAFADVFYDVASPEPIKPISRALVCLNPVKRWKIGFDGDLKVYDLRYTLAHEIGHAIGLDHPSSGGQIMGYRYQEAFRTLQAGDIGGAVLLYGEPRQAPVQVASPPTRDAVRLKSAARSFGRRWAAWGLSHPGQ